MCGAYGFSIKDAREVYDRFGVMNLGDYQPRYNTRPGQMLPVVYMTADGVQLKYMYWSFLPSWAKEKRLQFSTFNARDDRLLESKIYKSAVPHKRCIIPATHFFEPDRVHFPKPQPAPWYCFSVKEQALFGMAGLYNPWTDPQTGEQLYTFTIITTKPNAVVGTYHDREPALLAQHEESQWLNPDLTEPEQVLPLLKPYPPEQMESWRAPDAARNPRNDTPEVIKPVA